MRPKLDHFHFLKESKNSFYSQFIFLQNSEAQNTGRYTVYRLVRMPPQNVVDFNNALLKNREHSGEGHEPVGSLY